MNSELQPRQSIHHWKAVRQHLQVIEIIEIDQREERTTVDTFYNGPGLEPGFGHSADARRPLVVHTLVVRQELALTRSTEEQYRAGTAARDSESWHHCWCGGRLSNRRSDRLVNRVYSDDYFQSSTVMNFASHPTNTQNVFQNTAKRKHVYTLDHTVI